MKSMVKNINKQLKDKTASIDIIREEETALYRVVDKAAKKNVIHKNKASRVKSRVSRSISAYEQSNKSSKTTRSKSAKEVVTEGSGGRSAKSKSKSS